MVDGHVQARARRLGPACSASGGFLRHLPLRRRPGDLRALLQLHGRPVLGQGGRLLHDRHRAHEQRTSGRLRHPPLLPVRGVEPADLPVLQVRGLRLPERHPGPALAEDDDARIRPFGREDPHEDRPHDGDGRRPGQMGRLLLPLGHERRPARVRHRPVRHRPRGGHAAGPARLHEGKPARLPPVVHAGQHSQAVRGLRLHTPRPPQGEEAPPRRRASRRRTGRPGVLPPPL